MSTESYLEKNLRKFSITDFILIKLTYLMFSFLIFSLYIRLGFISWWFYFIGFFITAFPLWVYFFSLKGNLDAKEHAYLKRNNPARQVLLFVSIFFFACFLCVLFPVLASFSWWIYVVLAIVFAIKPATVSWTW